MALARSMTIGKPKGGRPQRTGLSVGADTLRINPILKQTFALIDEGGFNLHDLELASGLGYATIKRWMDKNGARLDSVQAVLEVMGYRLEIVKHEHISPVDVSEKVGKISVR